MAVTYTGATGVFTRIGKIFKAILALEDLQADNATYHALADEVLDSFGDDRDLGLGLHELMEGWRNGVDAQKAQISAYALAVLAQLADELDAPSADVDVIWPLFIERMKADEETVNANAVSVSAVSAGAANEGSGRLVVSKENLDGADVETLIPEALRVVCVADKLTGATSGGEVFRVSGEVPAPSAASYRPRGSGFGPDVTVANASSDQKILNAGFEDFTAADTPDSWDIDAGTVGTHILEEAGALRGDACLRFTGDGVEATLGISQTFASRAILPRTKYACGVWLRTADVAAGTITIRLAGTGYAPGASEKIEIAADWPETWTFYSFFVNTPRVVPDDFEIVVEVTDTLTDDATVDVDALALVPAAYHAGLSLALFGGADDFAVDDAFTFGVTNDEAGVFQTLFGKYFGVQLPSDDAGAETISDALCA